LPLNGWKKNPDSAIIIVKYAAKGRYQSINLTMLHDITFFVSEKLTLKKTKKFMKKVGASFVAAMLITVSVFACDLSDLMRGNTSLARAIRQYEKAGYVVVEGEQNFYSQFRYFAAPVAPYTDGSGTVVLRKSGENYSLQTEYVHISFEGNVEKNGRCTTSITDIYTQTVY